MLSLDKLLNPVQPEPRSVRDTPNSYPPSCPGSPARNTVPRFSQAEAKKQKMTKDGAIFTKGKIKGAVNFPPFQDLDAKAICEVQKYQVHPFGEIEEYPRHIPYNSEKKSFLEKTGRESFEVFQYEFNGPRDTKVYTVMWDYNIGLVRITPFFKCLHYSKTMPAKMLNLNPGLKEITHSITGGALAAQGYWMPYSCAFAVCATFCDEISGALTPLFGPTFPSQCVSKNSPNFPRMVIDASIIATGVAEAQAFRAQYSSTTPSAQASPTPSFATPSSRSILGHDVDSQSSHVSKRLSLKRTFTNGSLYNTGTDTDNDSKTSSGDRYLHSPFTPASTISPSIPHMSAWTPTNRDRTSSPNRTTSTYKTARPDGPRRYGHKTAFSCSPSPWLSAIPRSSCTIASAAARSTNEWPSIHSSKKHAEEVAAADEANGEGDEGYDGEASASGSERSNEQEEEEEREREGRRQPAHGETEMRAAWVLMQLSVRDSGHIPPRPLGALRGGSCTTDAEGPLAKRRRASSF